MLNNPLFDELSPLQLENLKKIFPPIKKVFKGEYLIREGDPPDNIYIIESGSVEILKQDPSTGSSYRISMLNRGDSIGELSLFRQKSRSASVKTLEDTLLLVIPLAALERLPNSQDIVKQIKINIASELTRRLLKSNDTTVISLKEKMEELTKRVELSKLTTRLMVGICFYMFALTVTGSLTKVVPDSSIITIPILACFAFGVYRTVSTSPYPKSAYGYTLKNWKKNSVEAILFSIPIAALIVAAKFAIVTYGDYQEMAVFDFAKSTGLSPKLIVIFSFAYAAFVPIQEMIRCAAQSSFQLVLTSKRRTLESIFLANLLFSATHLHVSPKLALMVFPLGIFWGWLFARQKSLVGPTVSHILLGIFGLMIIGFDAV